MNTASPGSSTSAAMPMPNALEAIVATMVQGIENADASLFASAFTTAAIYDDVLYGRFEGNAAIEAMVRERWLVDGRDFRWEMRDPVQQGDHANGMGYMNWVFSFTSTKTGGRAVMTGASRFVVREGLISDYREWCYDAAAMVGMGVPVSALEKRLKRSSDAMRALADPARHKLG